MISEVFKYCSKCKYYTVHPEKEPCCVCVSKNKWVSKDEEEKKVSIIKSVKYMKTEQPVREVEMEATGGAKISVRQDRGIIPITLQVMNSMSSFSKEDFKEFIEQCQRVLDSCE